MDGNVNLGVGDPVWVKIATDGERRIMYDGYRGKIRTFRGDDGPDREAFVESTGFQTVAFKEWFRLNELVPL